MKKISIVLVIAAILVCAFAGCSCQLSIGTPGATTTTAPTDPIPSIPSDELDPTEGFLPADDQELITGAELQVFALAVRDDILNGNWEKVAESISFPVKVGDKEFASAEEFLKEDWSSHFSEGWMEALRSDNCNNLEMVNNAFMIGDEGHNVWISVIELDDGTTRPAIIAINE